MQGEMGRKRGRIAMKRDWRTNITKKKGRETGIKKGRIRRKGRRRIWKRRE